MTVISNNGDCVPYSLSLLFFGIFRKNQLCSFCYCFVGHLEVVKLLVEKGADVSAVDRYDYWELLEKCTPFILTLFFAKMGLHAASRCCGVQQQPNRSISA